jgi:hypothetical protein
MLRRFRTPGLVQASDFDDAIETFCLPNRFPQGLPDPISLVNRIDRRDPARFTDPFVRRESQQSPFEQPDSLRLGRNCRVDLEDRTL